MESIVRFPNPAPAATTRIPSLAASANKTSTRRELVALPLFSTFALARSVQRTHGVVSASRAPAPIRRRCGVVARFAVANPWTCAVRNARAVNENPRGEYTRPRAASVDIFLLLVIPK